MPSLSSYERKKAHGYIAEKNIAGLKTQSEGEGTERALVLSYTGELIKRTTPSTYRPATNHIEMSISDEGVGI